MQLHVCTPAILLGSFLADASSTDDSEISTFFDKGKVVPKQLSLEYCLEFLDFQINICNNAHPSCKVQRPSILPRRVLDVNGESVRLVDTSTEIFSGQYITLSYCWGPAEALIKTTKATLRANLQCIEWSALPQTFQDAIKITRELGISYIWIDCLCIIQDDTYDWDAESAKMAQYYSQGFLNLAATSGSSPLHGLLQDRHSSDPSNSTIATSEPFELRVHHQGQMTSLFVRPAFKDVKGEFQGRGLVYGFDWATPLMKRAWVFQERILSRRTLHFHGTEMVYECQEALTCECDMQRRIDLFRRDSQASQLMGLKNRLPHPDDCTQDIETILLYWFDVVQEFSSKDITRESDRLLAFAGLARRLSDQFGMTYIAGLWLNDLPRQLLWHPTYWPKGRKRAEAPHAPTWSWASMINPVAYDQRTCKTFVASQKVVILEAEGSVSGENKFGAVHSGHITLTAPMIPVDLKLVERWPYFGWNGKTEGELRFDLDPPLDEDWKYDGSLESRQVYCLHLGIERQGIPEFDINVALLVISKGELGTFERIGVFEPDKLIPWFKDAEVGTITIV